MRGFAEARGAWPSIEVAEDVFSEYCAARPQANPARLPELYLSCACAHGDSAAIAVFQSTYFGEVDAAVRRLGTHTVDLNEARQLVSERLFSSAFGQPRIATWTGSGDLRMWLRVVSSRVVIDHLRKQPRELKLEDIIFDAPTEAADPELVLLKERMRPQLRLALTEALKKLDERQRFLLTCELEGRSLEELASIYRVHVRSVRRWMHDARETLLSELRGLFEKVAPGDVDSILRLMRSQIASSIASLLKS